MRWKRIILCCQIFRWEYPIHLVRFWLQRLLRYFFSNLIYLFPCKDEYDGSENPTAVPANVASNSLNDRETDRNKRKFVKTIAIALISCLEVILGSHAKTKNDAASQENPSVASRILDEANRKFY